MRSGLMRTIITIEKSTEYRDEFNTPFIEWLPLYKNIRVRKYQKSGQEKTIKSGDISKKTWNFKLWFMKEIDNKCRINENGIIFDIEDVLNVDNKNKELIIQAVEIGRRNIRGI